MPRAWSGGESGGARGGGAGRLWRAGRAGRVGRVVSVSLARVFPCWSTRSTWTWTPGGTGSERGGAAGLAAALGAGLVAVRDARAGDHLERIGRHVDVDGGSGSGGALADRRGQAAGRGGAGRVEASRDLGRGAVGQGGVRGEGEEAAEGELGLGVLSESDRDLAGQAEEDDEIRGAVVAGAPGAVEERGGVLVAELVERRLGLGQERGPGLGLGGPRERDGESGECGKRVAGGHRITSPADAGAPRGRTGW